MEATNLGDFAIQSGLNALLFGASICSLVRRLEDYASPNDFAILGVLDTEANSFSDTLDCKDRSVDLEGSKSA